MRKIQKKRKRRLLIILLMSKNTGKSSKFVLMRTLKFLKQMKKSTQKDNT